MGSSFLVENKIIVIVDIFCSTSCCWLSANVHTFINYPKLALITRPDGVLLAAAPLAAQRLRRLA